MDRDDAGEHIEPRKELDELGQQVIGATIEVHRHLGPGYLENVYEEAMAIEFGLRGISFERQVPVSLDYKGHKVGEGRLDFLVNGELLVELKAVETLVPLHKAQVISYLRATGLHLPLLIDFNVLALRAGIRRIVLSSS